MTTANTNELDKLQQQLRAMGGRYEIGIEGVSAESRKKILHLALTGRPLTTASPSMRAAITREVLADLSRGLPLTQGVFVRAAERALHGVFKLRLANEGNDLAWRKNPAGYRAAKIRRGGDHRTGVDSGALLSDFAHARVELVKR